MTEFFTKIALKHRKIVYIATGILTLLMFGAVSKLKMNPDWKELLPRDNEIVSNYIKIAENFTDITEMIITVSGDDSDAMRHAADEIVKKLKTLKRKKKTEKTDETGKTIKIDESINVVKNVYHKMPMEFFENHALMSMKANDLKDMLIMLDDPNIIASLDGINTALEKSYTGGEGDSEKLNDDEQKLLSSLQGMVDFFHILTESAEKEISDKRIKHAVDLVSVGEPYFFSHDKSMLLIYIQMAHSMSDSMEMTYDATTIINGINEWVKQDEKDENDYYKTLPHVNSVGYTGFGAIGKDEMDTISVFSIVFSFVALIIIFIVLSFSFRQITFPLIGAFVLLIGIIWALGTIILVFERLQMFTAICSFILIGLGIDFMIHIISRYAEERGYGKSIEESISKALNHTGPAVIVGGLTTSAAFVALVVSSMDGIVEFGIATGAGVFFQLIATFVLLPSLLVSKEMRSAKKIGLSKDEALEYTIDTEQKDAKDKQKNLLHLPRTDFPLLGSIIYNLFKNPVSAAVILVVLITISMFGWIGGSKVKMEYNFLNLEPEGLKSIELQHVIEEKFDQSPNITWVMADDLEEARAITNYYKTKVFVHDGDKIYKAAGFVDSISNYIQNDYEQAQSAKIIEQFRKTFENTTPRKIRKSDAQWLFKAKPSDSDVIEYNNLADNLEKSAVLREENEEYPAILKRLKDNFIEMYSLSIQSGLDKLTRKLITFGIGIDDNKNTVFDKMMKKLETVYKINPQILVEIMNRFNTTFFAEFKSRILQMCNTERVTDEMLPVLLRSMYVTKTKDEETGKDKKLYAISIFSKYNIWEKEPLMSFEKAITRAPRNPLVIEEKKIVETGKKTMKDDPFSDDDDADENPFGNEIEKADSESASEIVTNMRTIETLPTPTGTPQLMLLMIEETRREGVKAGFWALIVIFIILLVQFISTAKFNGSTSMIHAFGYTLLAAVPLFIAMSWMLGFMYLFSIKFNYLNFIAFPVIIGIGVDDGVHFVHRYRTEGRGSLRIVSSSVGKAILLTTITTGIGFGMLISNPFRGLASFGAVATIGIVCCFLATILVVPAILRIKEYFQGYKGYSTEK
ncbi:MAG: MMPL family transporter [Planctomycetes bacterium]|nr:MMPL family transporter [Planctomycetota bacterium]